MESVNRLPGLRVVFRRKETLNETERSVHKERAILVAVYQTHEEARYGELIEELGRLTDSAGGEVVGAMEQIRPHPDPAFYIGRGKVEELASEIGRLKADVVIVDAELAPTQVRNLEKTLNLKVIDRTELILDIFARHARTHTAQLQVELAQLEYTAPRLAHMWSHLERIEGGIGTRGPGERQIETDRRIIRKRIESLKERLRHIEERREREVRARRSETTISLVGYTNAGKSSLMNALTNAHVKVEDALFATLDTRTRKWELSDGRRALLSDTVGFIQRLPHDLVASFYATLEEARRADLLLHVVDVASPTAPQQVDTVERVLDELGCKDKPVILALNKCDLMRDETALPLLRKEGNSTVLVSARTGEGLDLLDQMVIKFLDEALKKVEVSFDIANGRIQAFLSERAKVLHRNFADSTASFEVMISPKEFDAVRKLGGHIVQEGKVLAADSE